MHRTAPIVLAILAVAGCAPAGPPTLDTTDDATLEASLGRMTGGMTEERKKEFMQGMMLIGFQSAAREAFGGVARPTSPNDPASNPTAAQSLKLLHGLTVAQIDAKAAEARARMKAKALPASPRGSSP